MTGFRSLSRSLTVALVTACALVWAGEAEARFGKASEPADRGSKSKSNGKKGSGGGGSKSRGHKVERGSSGTHAASAVRTRGGRDRDRGHRYGGHRRRGSRVYVAPAPCCGGGGVVVERHTYVGSEPDVHAHHPAPEQEQSGVQRFELLAGVQPALGAGIFSAGLLADWTRWGFDARVDNLLFLPEASGQPLDRVTLFDASITRSIVGNGRSRLRWHLGVSSAFAPDATFVGPSGGLSASAKVLGPLTFDAAANLTLIPFTKVDTRAGLGLRLGVVEVRGGVRMLAINDQGRVDGVHNTEMFIGPYAAAGLVF